MENLDVRESTQTYLDELVPTSGDDDGVLGVGAEANAGNPLGVALVGDGELAVTKGVPELDGAVTGSGDNLAVVGGERNGENVVGVADESPGGLTSGELPQAEGLVPGGGQSVGTVGGDHLYNPHERLAKSILPLMFFPVPPSRRSRSGFVLRCGDSSFFLSGLGHGGDGVIRRAYTVRDDVRVTLKAALGVTVGLLVAGQVPDDQGLVATAREQHVGAIIEEEKHKSQNPVLSI